MWVADDGSTLELGGIAHMIWRASKKEFGKAFGTHQFRYELATALAEADPDNSGLAAAVLGDFLRGRGAVRHSATQPAGGPAHQPQPRGRPRANAAAGAAGLWDQRTLTECRRFGASM